MDPNNHESDGAARNGSFSFLTVNTKITKCMKEL